MRGKDPTEGTFNKIKIPTTKIKVIVNLCAFMSAESFVSNTCFFCFRTENHILKYKITIPKEKSTKCGRKIKINTTGELISTKEQK